MKAFPIGLRAKGTVWWWALGLALGLWSGLAWGWLALWTLGWKTWAIVGTARIGSQFYTPTTCHGTTTKKHLALTFDDGFSVPKQTRKVLDLLDDYQVPATFFCIGQHLKSVEQGALLKRIHQGGHLVGNHSYSHAPLFDFYTKKRLIKELEQTDERIEQLIGQRPRWFRPPYGVTNPPIAHAVRATQHEVIGWSVRSLDTSSRSANALLNRLKRQVHPGAVVLFHDHIPLAAEVLPAFVDWVLKEGYTVVGLDQLLESSAYR